MQRNGAVSVPHSPPPPTVLSLSTRSYQIYVFAKVCKDAVVTGFAKSVRAICQLTKLKHPVGNIATQLKKKSPRDYYGEETKH